MDLLSDYRITTLLQRERELALRAERFRISEERRATPAELLVVTTGSLVTIPAH